MAAMKTLQAENLSIGKIMKKLYFTLMIPVLFVCACVQREDFHDIQMENNLTGFIASEPGTKTSLSGEEDGAWKVLWSEDDRIGVFVDGCSDANIYRLKEGAGASQAVFSGYGRGKSYIAVYPYDVIDGLDGETVSIVFPAEQRYTEGSFQNGSCPMIAVSSTEDLPFYNIGSILKISMTGRQTVTDLVFRSNDDSVKVSGPATVSLSSPVNPVLSMSQDGCDSLKVIIEEGIQLNEEVPSEFYLVLPPQTYKGGFTLRVYTTTGYMDKRLDSDFSLERSRVHTAKTFAVKLDVGVDPSISLEGAGTEDDPFRISSPGDLLLMQESVNAFGSIKGHSGVEAVAAKASYLLTTDLDLSQICSERSGKSWTPIADRTIKSDAGDYPSFSGTFDGGGHSITGLYINSYASSRGLFGSVASSGKICNLTVEGVLSGVSSYSGIIVGYSYGVLENCTSKGSVQSYGGVVGGMAGDLSKARFCTNKASVTSYNYAGGFAVYADYLYNCVNEGAISGSLSGGMAAYQNTGEIVNCINRGQVTGTRYIGGITGYSRQGAKVYNCTNLGNISGSGDNCYVGGICGFLSSSYARENRLTTMTNCINVGEVSISGSGEGCLVGALAGKNGYDDEFQNTGTITDYALIRQNYWLYDDGDPGHAGAVGFNTGRVDNNYALTPDQMKCKVAYDGVLYTSDDRSTYSLLLDALNACAYDLGKSTGLELSGWDIATGDICPVPVDLPALKPGSGQAVFSLSENVCSLLAVNGQFTVQVLSALSYTVGSLPGWISEGPEQIPENKPHTHIHTFNVSANETGSARSASIRFTNSNGTTLDLTVNQAEPYLVVPTRILTFARGGDSMRLQVSSSIYWTASSDVEWISVSPALGLGDGTVIVSADVNPNAEAREGSLTIAESDGSARYTVQVLQSGGTGGQNDWKNRPFHHNSLAMRFTATWCNWCPVMSTSIKRAQELYPDKILHLALHGSDSDLAFAPTGTLMSRYRTNSYPSGVVDGRVLVNNSTDTEAVAAKFVAAAKETESLYGTVSGLGIKSTSAGRNVNIDIDAYFKESGDYRITVLLVEDGIIHYQNNGGDNYRHDNIARIALTAITGDALKVDEPSKRALNYTVSVPSGYEIGNMRVFAYIQKSFGSSPKVQTGDYGDYYVDNCATAAVGTTLPLLFEDGGGGEGGGDNEDIIPGSEIK